MPVCPTCGYEAAPGNYCVRCGTSLRDGTAPRARTEFAAAPHERHYIPRIVSSLFPQLPKASMRSFQAALALGVVAVAALGAARLFPVALIGAAFLIPFLMVLYLYDADIYEGEPIRVVLLTMLWGAVVGVALGIVAASTSPSGARLITESGSTRIAIRGIAIPLAATVLALLGPLLLLRFRKFNDVLDGAFFGASAGVAFAAAEFLTEANRILEGGLRPQGQSLPWILRLLALAVASPVLSAGAIGVAAGAFWLRYRAPIRDRRSLGILGQPAAGLAFASALMVLGGLVQLLSSQRLSLALLSLLALVALLALRRVIHVGLLEEASEIEVGPEIVCANCDHSTASHTFCSNCGVALKALPKPGRAPTVAGTAGGEGK